jgi:hypothetical protein
VKINREELLRQLESVAPGLASKEILEQSACFVFQDGNVITYNDEISCRRPCDLNGVSGAVSSEPLLAILNRLSEEEVGIEAKKGRLIVEGKRKRTDIKMQKEVKLPINKVDDPKDWKDLDPGFCEAVNLVAKCAGSNEMEWIMTNVHITEDYMEAGDRFQIMRYPIKPEIDGSMLIKASSVRNVVSLGANQIAETKSWVHFKNDVGTLMSCRKYKEEYPNIDEHLKCSGNPATLPKGIDETVKRTSIFTSGDTYETVTISLKNSGHIYVRGEGDAGGHVEQKKVTYDGPDIKFKINPDLLLHICETSNECEISEGRLIIDNGKFRFVCFLAKEE